MPRVLVIDGQREVLDSIARVLRSAGFDVLATNSGGRAIGLARQHAVDLVIADLRLGDMTAAELLRRLRSVRGNVPVIVTGVASAAAQTAAIRTSPQVLQTIKVINERYPEPGMSVRSVARELGISTEHLCRLMKRHTGHTFVSLLRRSRVRAACHLLNTTSLSVKQIADRVGFGSPNHLARDFKTVCGTPPSVYRIRTRRES